MSFLQSTTTLGRIAITSRCLASLSNNVLRREFGAVRDAVEEALESMTQGDNEWYELQDDSHKHAGHAAMKGLNPEETHFSATIVSEQFNGLNSVNRQRMVYKLVKPQFDVGLHALSLTTKTPEE